MWLRRYCQFISSLRSFFGREGFMPEPVNSLGRCIRGILCCEIVYLIFNILFAQTSPCTLYHDCSSLSMPPYTYSQILCCTHCSSKYCAVQIVLNVQLDICMTFDTTPLLIRNNLLVSGSALNKNVATCESFTKGYSNLIPFSSTTLNYTIAL